mmetsp:Transcript_16288/g.23727  ORF Transcript_16288/g.23727 Transcript_16288/m.23727 type:complete len:81 (+) Transcript_16288:894-1136(+)
MLFCKIFEKNAIHLNFNNQWHCGIQVLACPILATNNRGLRPYLWLNRSTSASTAVYSCIMASWAAAVEEDAAPCGEKLAL